MPSAGNVLSIKKSVLQVVLSSPYHRRHCCMSVLSLYPIFLYMDNPSGMSCAARTACAAVNEDFLRHPRILCARYQTISYRRPVATPTGEANLSTTTTFPTPPRATTIVQGIADPSLTSSMTQPIACLTVVLAMLRNRMRISPSVPLWDLLWDLILLRSDLIIFLRN